MKCYFKVLIGGEKICMVCFSAEQFHRVKSALESAGVTVEVIDALIDDDEDEELTE